MVVIFTIFIDILHHDFHLSMEITLALVVGNDGLFWSVEGKSFSLGTRTDLRNVIQTQYHIL